MCTDGPAAEQGEDAGKQLQSSSAQEAAAMTNNQGESHEVRGMGPRNRVGNYEPGRAYICLSG